MIYRGFLICFVMKTNISRAVGAARIAQKSRFFQDFFRTVKKVITSLTSLWEICFVLNEKDGHIY